MKEESKKITLFKDILILVVIAIVAISVIFTKPISNLDEIWNFNFSRNVADGLVPYRDFNIVQMPLLAIICGIVFKVFGTELIIMRCMAVILMCLIFFMSYKVLKKLLPTNVTLFVFAIFLSLYKNVMCIDYNYAVLLIALVLLFIELKNVKEDTFKYSFRYNFILGIVAGIAILFKQTTGIAVAMACVGYKIFEIRKKEEIKEFLKIAFTRVLGVIIPVICFVVYLAANGAVLDFINYAILGIRTFSNKISYSSLLESGKISYLATIVPVALVMMFVLLFKKNTKRELYVLFAYAISTFIVAFPISDEIHFLIGSMISFIAISYMIYECVMENFEPESSARLKKMTYIIINFASIFFILFLLWNSLLEIEYKYVLVEKETELQHFKNIPEDKDLKEYIKEVDEYILQEQSNGKKVYILDASAAIYYIPINQYNKDYDMFLKGNLGGDGEDGIIDRINNQKNAIYLLKKSGLNWQNPNKVREYIINNLNSNGDILYFWIFNAEVE